MTPPAQVTVAIMPREKYSRAVLSLRSLFENTGEPFELIYIDGGSPTSVQGELDQLLSTRDHRLHRFDHYLGPFEANTIAIQEATTEYLVLADNDVHFNPGWLSALLRCAKEERADVVAPLVLIGDADTDVIHVAGGESHIEVADDGTRRYWHRQFAEWQTLNDPELDLHRNRTELVESHCLLARLDTWRALGNLDPAVGHITNVDELSQGFAAVDAVMWFEPAARVVYQFGPDVKLNRDDVRLMNYVWSESWISSDLARMADRHRIEPKERWWFGNQRRMWLNPVETTIRRFFTRLHIPFVGHVIWKVLELVELVCNRAYIAWAERFGSARTAAAPRRQTRSGHAQAASN